MPIYEYECAKCGKVTEEFQKFSDSPLKKCRECGGKIHKLMSLNAFHLKGSGWYVTDYKGKNSSTSADKEPGETTESKDKKEKKPEKKAAKK